MTEGYVLDAFAVIMHLRRQPDYLRVRALLKRAHLGESRLWMSEVNLGEVLYIIERQRGLAGVQSFLSAWKEGPVEAVAATFERVQAAAHFKARYPISYADAFAAALAQELGATLVTGDPEFHAVEHLVTIEWLREGG